MPPKKKRKSRHSDASPAKSLARELAQLQTKLRQTLRAYQAQLEGGLDAVKTWNKGVAKKDASREEIRNIGDMLGLVRKLKVKPEKGRRRDVRKIDRVIDDLVSVASPDRAR